MKVFAQRTKRHGRLMTNLLAAWLLVFSVQAAQAQTLELRLPDVEANVGEEITIAVEAVNVAGKGVSSFTIGVTYDPNILDDDFSVSTNGTIAAGYSALPWQNPDGGEFRAIYSRPTTDPLDEDGTILILKTTVIGEGTTALAISSVSYLENGPVRVEYTTVDGSVTTDVEVTDNDGIDDAIEDAVPNPDGSGTGDGNGDGVQDSEQANVASLVNETDGGYVTVASSDGTRLANVTASATPSEPAPDHAELPDGTLSFGVTDLDVGGATTVTIFTSNEINGYLKYGPTPDNPADHWYDFSYNGTTGAEILSDRIVLHFVDGLRGDGDLTANGEIDDPGAPTFYTNTAPSAAQISSPTVGAQFTIGGGSGEEPEDGETTLLTVSWDEATDPDGDAVSYRLDVSNDETFSTTLSDFEVGGNTSMDVTVEQAAGWFDAAHGDAEVGADVTLYFRVVSSDENFDTTSESAEATFFRGTVASANQDELPGGFELHGNYPNPFNPSTTVRFDLAQNAEVGVDVYDLLGRHVLSVPPTAMQAGADRSVRIEASELPSGTYVYRVIARSASETTVRSGRMTLVK